MFVNDARQMKYIQHPLFAVACLAASLCLLSSACSSLKSEFLSAPTTNAVTGAVSPAVSNLPPIVPQLNEAAGVAGACLPAPWGGIVSGLLTLAASGAAAFASFHARKAAVASAGTTATPVQSAPVSATPTKT